MLFFSPLVPKSIKMQKQIMERKNSPYGLKNMSAFQVQNVPLRQVPEDEELAWKRSGWEVLSHLTDQLVRYLLAEL